MKSSHIKRFVAVMLVVIMVASMVPAQVLAATVTTTPGNTELNVEYFTSTFFNWNEDKANCATQVSDLSASATTSLPTVEEIQNGYYFLDEALTQRVVVEPTGTPRSATVTVGTLASSNSSSWKKTAYYYHPEDDTENKYYTLFVKRNNSTYTYGYSVTGYSEEVVTIGQQTTTSTRTNANISLYSFNNLRYNVVCDGETIEGPYSSTTQRLTTLLYSGTLNKKGFYFTSGNKPSAVPAFSNWTNNKQDYFIYSGLAQDKLSESVNKPFSNTNVNAANLFATDGSNSAYTSVYQNVRVPYVYNAETGYYTLDSDAYAVYFNGTPADGATMNIANKPVSFYQYTTHTQGTSFYGTGLLPFNGVSTTTRNATYGVKEGTTGNSGSYVKTNVNVSNNVDTNVVYGFGMVTTVPFQMTDDGKLNGEPIQFKFSGDDDVWVYVDDTLVLDIGGTHAAVVGTIDFSTGNVHLSSPAFGKLGDKATIPGDHTPNDQYAYADGLTQQNMYEKLGTTLTGFSAQGQHTLTVYYMDRGRGSTNCIIEFNLPQRDTLSVTKDFTQSKTPAGVVSELTDAEQEKYNNVPFGFTLYDDQNNVVANKTYYIYENGLATGRSAATDGNGHFTLTNGQTAKFNVTIKTEQEGGSSWHVVEDPLSETAYCTPAYIVNGGDLTGGYSSPAVVKTGSNTAADEYSIVCYNYMNSNIPNPYTVPHDDTIVLDYGLPITIDPAVLLANDITRGDSYELIGLSKDPISGAGTAEEVTASTSVAGRYGNAVFADDEITYTLNKEFNGIETLYYVAKATGTGYEGTQEITKTWTATGKIVIIPATSVYYEENFGSFITYNTNADQWSAEGEAQNEYQETGYVGTGKSTYGSDPAYLNDSGDSNGSSMKADTSARACSFEYDFTGSGTTIYGRISEDTAYIRVVVTKGGNVEDQQLIDTRVLAGAGELGTLYNIPIYNNSGLDFGTYHVKVTIAKAGTVLPAGESGAYFWLDGIRVYNPMGNNETALSAYAVDNENNTVVINIRTKVEGDGRECIFTLTDVDDMIVDLETYEAIGPNEELYLADGFGEIGFDLINWNAQFYKLYIGLKNPDGNGAAVNIGGHEFTINNSSDCYYDISQYVEFDDTYGEGEDAITVHTVELESVSGLVSLTNIKVVGVDEFDIGEANNIVVDGDNGEDGNAFVPGTLYFAPLGFFKNDATDDVEDEPVVFVPERVSASVSYSAKTKKATFMVATYTDVSYITVNGVRYDGKVASGKVKFTDTYKNVAAGTVYEVICFNADGIASEPIYITAK